MKNLNSEYKEVKDQLLKMKEDKEGLFLIIAKEFQNKELEIVEIEKERKNVVEKLQEVNVDKEKYEDLNKQKEIYQEKEKEILKQKKLIKNKEEEQEKYLYDVGINIFQYYQSNPDIFEAYKDLFKNLNEFNYHYEKSVKEVDDLKSVKKQMKGFSNLSHQFQIFFKEMSLKNQKVEHKKLINMFMKKFMNTHLFNFLDYEGYKELSNPIKTLLSDIKEMQENIMNNQDFIDLVHKNFSVQNLSEINKMLENLKKNLEKKEKTLQELYKNFGKNLYKEKESYQNESIEFQNYINEICELETKELEMNREKEVIELKIQKVNHEKKIEKIEEKKKKIDKEAEKIKENQEKEIEEIKNLEKQINELSN